jgi:hypothetical protein
VQVIWKLTGLSGYQKVHLSKNAASFKEIWNELILSIGILKWHIKDIPGFVGDCEDSLAN